MSAAEARATTGVGQVVAGRYRILKRVGTGGMGSVFEAFDLRTKERVAVKLLRQSLRRSAPAARRFRREGELLAEIDHPCVVRVHAAGELADGTLYIAMEMLRGRTLRDRLREGPMAPWELLPVLNDIAAGLAALHAHGIVHRDLKPANVVIAQSGRPFLGNQTLIRERAKLVDFGVARAHWRTRLTDEGQVVGTLRCMAPEQIRAEPDVDGRVDLYALGVMLYEALTGRHPFRGRADRIVQSVLHGRYSAPDTGWPAIDQVILTAMSARREERYQTVRALAAAFTDAVFESCVPGAPRRPPEHVEDSAVTAEAGYEATTVNYAPRAPARSGTRMISGRLASEPPTRSGHPRQPSDAPEMPTEHGYARPISAAPAPAPFEVIPTMSYGGMPLPCPTAAPPRRAPRRGRWLAVLALVLGMLVGAAVTGWLVH